MKSRMVISSIFALPFKRTLILIASFLLLTGCLAMVKPIILSVPELSENYTEYEGKRVQLVGQIVEKYFYGNYGGLGTWNFILDAGGKKIRCYEDTYRRRSNHFADMLVMLAMESRQKGKPADVTVVGDVKKEGLELYSIEYMNTFIRTDFYVESEELLHQMEELERFRR